MTGIVGPWSFTGELLGATLVLATIEYAIIGLVIGRAFHGKKLRQLAKHRAWIWQRGDPERRLEAAPRHGIERVRRRRVRFTMTGDGPLGPFTLWAYRHPWAKRRDGRHTVLVAMHAPPNAHELHVPARDAAVRGDDAARATHSLALDRLIRAHPEVAWTSAEGRLWVSSRRVKTLDDLQALVALADQFRALVPLQHITAPPEGERTPLTLHA